MQLAGAAILLSGAILLFWVAWRFVVLAASSAQEAYEDHYVKALPAEIGVTSLLHAGSNVNWMEYLVPARRKACGGAVFQLSSTAATQVAAEGLAVLQPARVERGYRGTKREDSFTYEAWHQTPVPTQWTGDGMWRGLDCLDDSGFRVDEILRAAREPGSYYTSSPSSKLLVIPRSRTVVLTYDK